MYMLTQSPRERTFNKGYETMSKIVGRVLVRPTANSSQRVKMRIRTHGPVFTIIEHRTFPVCMGGVESTCIRSVSTDWVGWVPTAHVILES